jgi:hypothetical protein
MVVETDENLQKEGVKIKEPKELERRAKTPGSKDSC